MNIHLVNSDNRALICWYCENEKKSKRDGNIRHYTLGQNNRHETWQNNYQNILDPRSKRKRRNKEERGGEERSRRTEWASRMKRGRGRKIGETKRNSGWEWGKRGSWVRVSSRDRDGGGAWRKEGKRDEEEEEKEEEKGVGVPKMAPRGEAAAESEERR